MQLIKLTKTLQDSYMKNTAEESYILSPNSFECFFKENWLIYKPLHIKRKQANYFENLISLKEIDRLVCNSKLPLANLTMAKDNTPLGFSEYTDNGLINPDKVLFHHKKGATIILRSIEQWSPSIASIRIEVEKLLGFEVQVNVYLTPPNNKSTPPHWDTHDLFVLQLFGKKTWNIYDGERSLPIENERFRVGEDKVIKTGEKFTLKAGDTLFLPRGVIHEPIADSYSIHLSLGIKSIRWLDVFQKVLQVEGLKNGSFLRETLNINNMKPQSEILEYFKKVTSDKDIISNAIKAIVGDVNDSLWKDYNDSLVQHININNNRVDFHKNYQLRHGIIFEIIEISSSIILRNNIKSIKFPIKMKKSLELVMGGASFNINNLPLSTDDEKKAILIALLNANFIH